MVGERTVTVCAECLQASCWQGVFMCQKSQNANIVEKTVGELERLDLEHPDYWEEGAGIDFVAGPDFARITRTP